MASMQRSIMRSMRFESNRKRFGSIKRYRHYLSIVRSAKAKKAQKYDRVKLQKASKQSIKSHKKQNIFSRAINKVFGSRGRR